MVKLYEDPTDLNVGQQAAYDGITELFKDKKGQVAILKGAAGTGKTYLTKYLAMALKPKLTALTHKACEVAAKATGKDVITLAKLLKQQKYNDYDSGETHFKGKKKIEIFESCIFVDEYSMISLANLNDLLAAVDGRYNLLLIGDRYQLPAVSLPPSPEHLNGFPVFELTEPCRFDPLSGINATAVSIRTAMRDDTFKIAGMAKILQKHSDTEWITAAEAYPRMIEAFTDMKHVDEARLISFTNGQVHRYNKYLKESLSGKADGIAVGDLLVANEAIQVSKTGMIRNNEVLLVKGVSLVTIEGIDCYHTVVGAEQIHTVNIPVDMPGVLAEVERLRAEALKLRGDARRETFRRMFRFKELFADLRISYAQTVHKSQGSTYNTVFFDLTKLDVASIMGRHLLYTGTTRASEKLIFFR